MNPSTVTLRIEADGRQAVGEFRGVSQASGAVGDVTEDATRRGSRGYRDLNKEAKAAGLVLAGVGAAAAAGLGMLIRGQFNAADASIKAAQAAGESVERFTGLSHAANLAGIEQNRLSQIMTAATRMSVEAAAGTGRAAEAYAALGISVQDQDGRLRSSGDLLMAIGERFREMPDGAEKTALAIATLGRSGAEAIPLLNSDIAGLVDQAERLGLVIDTRTAQASERFNDALTVLGQSVTGLGNRVVTQLAPGFADLAEQAAQAAEDNGFLAKSADVISNVVKGTVIVVMGMVDSVRLLADVAAASGITVVEIFSQMGSAVTREGAQIGRVILAIAARDAVALANAARGIGGGLSDSLSAIRETVTREMGLISESYDRTIQRGSDRMLALLDTTNDLDIGARRTVESLGYMAGGIEDAGEAAGQAGRDEVPEYIRALGMLEDAADDVAGQLGGASVQAAQQYRDALLEVMQAELALAAAGELTAERQAQIDALRTQLAQNYQLRQAEITASESEFTTQSVYHADEYQRAWMGGIDSVADAFGAWVSGGISSFEDFGKSLINIAKDTVKRIIAEFARTQILRMFGMGGGGMGMMGSAMAGPAGMGGMAGNGMLPGMGQYMPMAAGAAGAIYGYQNAGNGGLSSLGAAAAYGGLAWTGATIGYGAVLGAGAGAAAGGAGAAAGGALSGGLGAAGAVPIVGWVLAIAALVDMFSGGKLFGTRHRPESFEQTIALGEDGAQASAQLTEVRQRSLFRGRSWRTTDQDPGDEAREAAQQFFEHVSGAMSTAAERMGSEIAPMIDASIRTVTEYDKKGRETGTKILVDAIGRTWEEETAELAATRITAEALIAQVDFALGNAVEQVAEAAAGAVGDGLGRGNVGDLIGDQIQYMLMDGAEAAGAAADTAAEVVTRSASAIAERWRGDAEQLLAGAQLMVAAAGDIIAGVSILGSDATLGGVVDLVEDMAYSGEELLGTYGRLVASTHLYTDALRTMGVETEILGEELVRHSVAIAEAAGGLDRAQALWRTFFGSFYSPEELLQLDLTAAQNASSELLSALGLDPEITGAEFRAAFEAAIAGGLAAEATVQWLEAGAALAGTLSIEQQLAQIRAEAAEAAQLQLQQEQERLEQLRQARADYGATVRELGEQLLRTELSEFSIEMREIQQWANASRAELTALARAAGLAGAAESDLALVHEIAARRAAQAIAQLQASAFALARQLTGTDLSGIEGRIREMEMAQQSAHSAQISGIGEVGNAASQMYQQQLQALAQITDWLDSQLLGSLSSLTPMDQLAEARRQFEAAAAAAPGDASAAAALPGLANTLLQLGQGAFASGTGFVELEAFVRETMASVAGALGNATAGGPPMVQLAPGWSAEVGGSVSTELRALYAERDAMLAEQQAAEQLALWQDLAVMVADLVTATGDPLDEVLAGLRLTQAEMAAGIGINEEDLAAYIDGLTQSALITELGALVGIENLAAENVTHLIEHTQLLGAVKGELERIADMIGARNTEDGLPSFDVGTANVPRDMRANIHRGEIIIDPASSAALRRYGIRVDAGGSGRDTGELVTEVRALRSAFERATTDTRDTLATRLDRVVDRVADVATATRQSGETVAREVRTGSEESRNRRY